MWVPFIIFALAQASDVKLNLKIANTNVIDSIVRLKQLKSKTVNLVVQHVACRHFDDMFYY